MLAHDGSERSDMVLVADMYATPALCRLAVRYIDGSRPLCGLGSPLKYWLYRHPTLVAFPNEAERSMENTPWYNKTLWVVLALVLFFPLGFYALYKNETWSKNAKLIAGGVVGVIVLIGLLSPPPPPPADSGEPELAASSAPEVAEAVEAPPPDLRTQVAEAVADELGAEANWGDDLPRLKGLSLNQAGDAYVAQIDFRANDNLSRGFIRGGLVRDVMDVIQRLSQEARFDSLSSYQLTPIFPLSDQYGNTSEGAIGRVEMSRDVARRVNWDNMTSDMFEQLLMREGVLILNI